MVDAKFYMEFICEESCRQMFTLPYRHTPSPCRCWDDITKGKATIEELDKIGGTCSRAHESVRLSALSARPHPTRSLPPFVISARSTRITSSTRDVQQKKCGRTPHYQIDLDKCKGSRLFQKLPCGRYQRHGQRASSYRYRYLHQVWLVKQNCKFDAVYME